MAQDHDEGSAETFALQDEATWEGHGQPTPVAIARRVVLQKLRRASVIDGACGLKGEADKA